MLKIHILLTYILALFCAVAAGVMAGATLQEYDVPEDLHSHDVAPAVDGGVWYTAQHPGALGYLDPETGRTRHIDLGKKSAPHGVIVGPDGSPWITDSGLNAIIRVDAESSALTRFSLPSGTPWANFNTATFDNQEQLWFTGLSGYYGRLILKTGKVEVFDALRGRGPNRICTAPDGSVYYASLAGNHLTRIDTASETFTVFTLPSDNGKIRQILGWPGEVWGSESGVDKLVVLRLPDVE